MRSRTSRGVPEWSRGKDLYMGSSVLVTGKVSGDIGNVPGPPGGARGSTKWGHMLQRHTWAKYERAPAPRWARAPPTMAHAARGGEGANPKGIWALGPILVRLPLPSPLGRLPKPHLGLAAPLGGETLDGGAALSLPYIYLRFGLPIQTSFSPSWRSPTSLLLVSCGAWRSPAGVPRSSTTTTPPCCCCCSP